MENLHGVSNNNLELKEFAKRNQPSPISTACKAISAVGLGLLYSYHYPQQLPGLILGIGIGYTLNNIFQEKTTTKEKTTVNEDRKASIIENEISPQKPKDFTIHFDGINEGINELIKESKNIKKLPAANYLFVNSFNTSAQKIAGSINKVKKDFDQALPTVVILLSADDTAVGLNQTLESKLKELHGVKAVVHFTLEDIDHPLQDFSYLHKLLD